MAYAYIGMFVLYSKYLFKIAVLTDYTVQLLHHSYIYSYIKVRMKKKGFVLHSGMKENANSL